MTAVHVWGRAHAGTLAGSLGVCGAILVNGWQAAHGPLVWLAGQAVLLTHLQWMRHAHDARDESRWWRFHPGYGRARRVRFLAVMGVLCGLLGLSGLVFVVHGWMRVAVTGIAVLSYVDVFVASCWPRVERA